MKADAEGNRRERIGFVRLWADFVRSHKDREWSEQQRVLIDSQLKNAKSYPLTIEEYLEIKKAGRRKGLALSPSPPA